MKKIILFMGLLIGGGSVFANVYHPNDGIDTYLDDVNDQFINIDSQAGVANTINPKFFLSLSNDFFVLKDKLPQLPNYILIYNQCYQITKKLSQSFDESDYQIFKSRCMGPYKASTRTIFTQYALKANINAKPTSGNTPLTVTFDGRGSVDPSNDTIPTDNFYWYFKDTNGNEVYIGKGSIINHTFEQEGRYIVHMTVKSVNKEGKGIMDGSTSVVVNVAPPIANTVLFINGKKALTHKYSKVSTLDGKKGVKLDASGTTPRGGTIIQESIWSVKYKNNEILNEIVDGFPGTQVVKLEENGQYDITLIIRDNMGKSVTTKFKLIVSDPVATMTVSPEDGDTSTTFSFDANTSYSIKGKIVTYKWLIIGPTGERIETFESQEFERKFIVPGIYAVKLEVIDNEGKTNSEEYKLQVDSTEPVAQFHIREYSNWEKPSRYIFDATPSSDADLEHGDELSYEWYFTNDESVRIRQDINKGKQLIVDFDKPGDYEGTLTVTDRYGKKSSITKQITIDSTLRPEISISPNYTILGETIVFTVKSNKTVAYYEWDFGDGRKHKTQDNEIPHVYMQSGRYFVKVEAFSSDGDSNSIEEPVFVGQKWHPIAMYSVYKDNKEKLKTTSCIKVENNKKIPVRAYLMPRQEEMIIDGTDSVNGNGGKDLLKIFFKEPGTNENILLSSLNKRFDELGCQKLYLNAIDLATNKSDRQEIWFKIVNAKPTLDDVVMEFPQFGNQRMSMGFQPGFQQQKSNLPKDIFEKGIDPLLVKIQAINAYDPDYSIISHFTWYYYKKEDPNHEIEVKITPYNINSVVFALSRIPGTYVFGVEICDVDEACVRSEKILKGGPTIIVPASNSNPDIPIVTVRVDEDGAKGIGETNVGKKVIVHVFSKLISGRKDFKRNRTIKIDFDGDGKFDITTKKERVEYTYKKTGKYKVKAAVLYRGYRGLGYSAPLILKKGLKASYFMEQFGKNLLFWDLSYGDIEKRSYCMDIRKCKKSKNFLVTNKTGFVHTYIEPGKKYLNFKIEDKYGNQLSSKKIITIKDETTTGLNILSIPRVVKEGDIYHFNIGGNLGTSMLMKVETLNIGTGNCFIDTNVSVDSDGNGDSLTDRDLECNELKVIAYGSNRSTVVGKIYIDDEVHDFQVNLLNIEVDVPEKYKYMYNKIEDIILLLNKNITESVKYLKTHLLRLQNSLGDRGDMDASLFEIKIWLDANEGELSEKIVTQIMEVFDGLKDKAVIAATEKDEYSMAKERIIISIIGEDDFLNGKFNDIDNSAGNKSQIKLILQEIMDLVKKQHTDGDVDDATLNFIKQDICVIMTYFKIDSKACGTEKEAEVVEKAPPKKTTINKILKIVGTVVGVLFLIFIILVAIFVVKAKKRREQKQEEETTKTES